MRFSDQDKLSTTLPMDQIKTSQPMRDMGARTAALATRHGKERVIAPAFARLAGIALRVAEADTDALGTFTGEIPRALPMRETVLAKARLGADATGLPLAIASEGSFGPHPVIPFLAAAHEMMAFVDLERGLEIVESRRSEATNFAALDVTAEVDVDAFLARIGFPQHALIFRSGERLVKGIMSRAHLGRLIATASAPVRLETDMRAHMNPTRMAEIGKLAEALARRIGTPCPSCGAPGFGVIRSVGGLPCKECGTETPLTRALVLGCALCRHEQEFPRPDGRTTATPAECQECNP